MKNNYNGELRLQITADFSLKLLYLESKFLVRLRNVKQFSEIDSNRNRAITIIASAYVANLALNSPVNSNIPMPNPSSSPTPTVSAGSPSPTKQNESAIYTFTVAPTITSYESYWNDTDFNQLFETTFHVNAQITWDKIKPLT